MTAQLCKIVLALTILATATYAGRSHAEPNLSKEHQECYDNVDLGALKKSQWANCDAQELQRLDIILNREYKKLQKSLSADARKQLVMGQRSWLRYREDWCKFEEVAPWAPGGTANYTYCLLEVTDKQIELLKSSQL